ncbi:MULTISPECIES: DUF3054 domain-containing protein [Halobacterium]|uniref:DUF3054 family protein n=4 Tax=Halobacterium salinarum TaxID=2242 RepID=Q9HQ25_HALSA|nr:MULTISPECIES: DUF3054 domain-containing protein [Halobacterium]AAG19692.1 hypothetical protein VNG_1362H [Halobacterium salinarum NRC-1]MBB6088694.1 hypothetical protein [Halobacterium salinarum]MCF2165200.1 DUF3054 domain-containing protein [Halobacterium salinarum]MCF2167991.1 DUF3054 domain-containing protein [Halobacterium salinarum]MCF2207015.1 DUF3054 domain-containing protein [Halobacterium salinarum]
MTLTDVDGRAVARFLPGDVVVILVVILAGTLRHGTFTPQEYAGVLLPFLIGWLAAAPLVGAYSASTVASNRRAIVLAAGTWLAADLIGQLIRNTAAFPGNADPTFFLVMFATVTAGLAIARFITLVVVDLRGS